MAIVNVNKMVKDYTLDNKAVTNIKALALDMINEASSGHPGIVLGAAPILYRLYSKHLVFDYNNPNWINRDRFVMSAGHGSALLYATLFMSGFNLTVKDLKEFRKYGSKTPGHPEVFATAGVDATTGPLGQGLANAVGMAVGEAYLNKKFKYLKNSLFDHYTYVFVSDGDLMEGVSSEVMSLAGSLGLGKLIVLYDSNDISLDGKISKVFNDNILEKYKAMGWDTHFLEDAYDFDTFDNLIEKCKMAQDKPSIIQIKTIIGKDSKFQNTNAVHGKPLTKDDIKRVKKKIGIRDVPFTVLSESCNYMKKQIDERNNSIINKWQKTEERLLSKFSKELNEDYEKLCLLDQKIDFKKNVEGLNVSHNLTGRDMIHSLINELRDNDFMCLTTDTSSSTRVFFDDVSFFEKRHLNGKNLACGVRELGASSIANGLSLMGIRPIVSTFLSFSNYMIPAIRMASLMKLNPIYIFTHDSVLVGEDGPTHQPIEQIDMLRLIPGVSVFRPCDKNEIIGAFKCALQSNRPTVIVVSKDVLPDCECTDINKTSNGGYILKDNDKNDLCIIASGFEIGLALEISNSLEKHMINSRVVSMPSLEEFDKLKDEEKEKILPNDSIKVVLELSSCSSYYKYLNKDDFVFNVSDFMKSGNRYSIIHRLSYDCLSITKEITDYFKQRM